jgi:large-conductance mechanosensitive channel
MADNQVVTFAIAIFIGMSLTKFFNALIRDLVLPLLSPLASSEGEVAKLVVVIGGIKFNIGDLIVQTVNLGIVFAVVSFALPYLKEYVPVAGRR